MDQLLRPGAGGARPFMIVGSHRRGEDRAEGALDIELYDRLVEAARGSETVAYGELGDMLHLDFGNPNDRRRVGVLLGEISRFEVAAGRPMLSSVVIHKDDFQPGRGFFALGQELGLVQAGEDDMAFAIRQLKATWAAWAGRAGGQEL